MLYIVGMDKSNCLLWCPQVGIYIPTCIAPQLLTGYRKRLLSTHVHTLSAMRREEDITTLLVSIKYCDTCTACSENSTKKLCHYW